MLSQVLITEGLDGALKARFGFSHFILVQSFIEFLTAFSSNPSLHSILDFMISIFLLFSFLASPLLLFPVPQNSTNDRLQGNNLAWAPGVLGGAELGPRAFHREAVKQVPKKKKMPQLNENRAIQAKTFPPRQWRTCHVGRKCMSKDAKQGQRGREGGVQDGGPVFILQMGAQQSLEDRQWGQHHPMFGLLTSAWAAGPGGRCSWPTGRVFPQSQCCESFYFIYVFIKKNF